jgi:hypothetical protein
VRAKSENASGGRVPRVRNRKTRVVGEPRACEIGKRERWESAARAKSKNASGGRTSLVRNQNTKGRM